MANMAGLRRVMLARRSHPVRFAGAVLAIAAPTLLRLAIDGGEGGVPFVTYFPAIMLAALFLGWEYAALTAFGSAVVAKRLFMGGPPLLESNWQLLVWAGMYFLSCALLIGMVETMRRALVRLAAQAKVQRTLTDELRHRVKNMLAVVQGLAVMTSRNADPAKFRQNFSGRLAALAKATDLISTDDFTTCRMPLLVEEAIKPFRNDGNFTVEGPQCRLPRDCCVPTVLALHELSTNALKHGALSMPGGRVAVTWRVEGETLVLAWIESGGPPVAEPKRRGMGSRLLVAQPGLDGVELKFERAGFQCHLRIEGAQPVA